MKIYTRTGDEGDTGLFGGGRVPKNHPRVEAYGDVDELNAAIGLARALGGGGDPQMDELLLGIQRDLFSIGALLATPDHERMKQQLRKARLDEERIAGMERMMDAADEELEPLRTFILPGGAATGAALHVARTVCRRAERRVVSIRESEGIPAAVVIYLNRLSDLLFTLARLANRRAGAEELPW
jgi:cob(I)alamin adenosyltransferase